MYKDKDKQRQAVREAVRRYRARRNTRADVIPCNTQDVIPEQSHNPMKVGYVPPSPA